MATHAKHLRLVRMVPADEEASSPDSGEVALVAVLFGINLLPVLGTVLRFGHWGTGTVGLAAACVILTGRELVSQVRDILRARR